MAYRYTQAVLKHTDSDLFSEGRSRLHVLCNMCRAYAIFVRVAASIAMALALRRNKEVTCALARMLNVAAHIVRPFDAFVLLFITVSKVMLGVLHGMWGRDGGNERLDS